MLEAIILVTALAEHGGCLNRGYRMTPLFERRRSMPPALFGVLFLPSGMSQGFVTVALGYELAQRGLSVNVIAGLVGFPQ
jgi:hypothetical protein